MEPVVVGIKEKLRFVPRVLPALALLVSGLACNALQGIEVGSPSGAGGSQRAQALIDAGSELLDRWQDRPAFYVVMAALDSGYSADQVIDNAAALAPDGAIAGVEPAGPPLDMLSPTGPAGEGPPGEAGLGAAARIVPAGRLQTDSPADQYVADVDGWLSEIWEAGQEAIREPEPIEGEDDGAAARFEQSVAMLTLELAGRGYSGDQIVEALLLDSLSDRAFGMGCYYIEGPDGAPLRPANDPIAYMQGSCPPLAEQEAEPPEQGGNLLRIRSADAYDGFCHDTIVKLSGGGQYQICIYQISWELVYQGVDVPAEASCYAEGLGRRNQDEPGGFFGIVPSQRLTERRGSWSGTFEESGQYSAPGVYEDRIVCELHAGADGEGELLDRVQADITVDISEVRAID